MLYTKTLNGVKSFLSWLCKRSRVTNVWMGIREVDDLYFQEFELMKTKELALLQPLSTFLIHCLESPSITEALISPEGMYKARLCGPVVSLDSRTRASPSPGV